MAVSYPVDPSVKPLVEPFFDPATNTVSYVVADPAEGGCAVIDSVLDFDYAAGRIGTTGAERIIAYIRSRGLTLQWLIETHVHADHLSAARHIQRALGGKICIGRRITQIQETIGALFGEGPAFKRDGSQFDVLLDDGETYMIGGLQGFAMHTPGHTPACMVHVIGDAAFVGDTLFMPDGGSARADFPGGNAGELYDSIQKILALPSEMRLFMCHDYAPNGRPIRWESTVAEQRADNIHVGGNTGKQAFVTFRTERDATLDMPRLIIPSLQINMRAGDAPLDTDGRPIVKVPLNRF